MGLLDDIHRALDELDGGGARVDADGVIEADWQPSARPHPDAPRRPSSKHARVRAIEAKVDGFLALYVARASEPAARAALDDLMAQLVELVRTKRASSSEPARARDDDDTNDNDDEHEEG